MSVAKIHEVESCLPGCAWELWYDRSVRVWYAALWTRNADESLSGHQVSITFDSYDRAGVESQVESLEAGFSHPSCTVEDIIGIAGRFAYVFDYAPDHWLEGFRQAALAASN